MTGLISNLGNELLISSKEIDSGNWDSQYLIVKKTAIMSFFSAPQQISKTKTDLLFSHTQTLPPYKTGFKKICHRFDSDSNRLK